jgi:hypothetical protein
VNLDVARLIALSPPDDARINARVRVTCAQALSLPPLPAEVDFASVDSEAESAAVDFAEQFAVDVTGITDAQRGRLLAALGERAFRAVVLMYVADFVPRVRAGLDALGLGDGFAGPVAWDHASDPADVVFNEFLPAVARLDALDPLTLCKSLREGAALDAGGSETLYGDIERYESSALLTDRQKVALRYVDGLIWSPAAISAEIAAGVREHFSDDAAVELTLDVMRNASNKIAVAFAADTPRVEQGTEVYRILPDGQLEYT